MPYETRLQSARRAACGDCASVGAHDGDEPRRGDGARMSALRASADMKRALEDYFSDSSFDVEEEEEEEEEEESSDGESDEAALAAEIALLREEAEEAETADEAILARRHRQAGNGGLRDLLGAPGVGDMPEDEREFLRARGSKERDRYQELERCVARCDAEAAKPWRFRVLDSDMPKASKALALRRLDDMRRSDPNSPDNAKYGAWFSALMTIPFGKYTRPMVSPADGVGVTTQALLDARQHLDGSAYGHEAAKADLLGVVANCISHPGSAPPALALCGSPGIGKTTLIRNGVARALGRPFVQISLGGAQDASLLNGHGFCYEGSSCGAVAQALIDSEVMDPVILFDELDKVSTTRSGEEVTHLLLHLCDGTQNSEVTDRYFGQIPLDLSRAMLCFSFNDESLVNPVLLDRLKVVRCPDHAPDDKRAILRQFILPEALRNVGLEEADVALDDAAVEYLLSLSRDEPGVRGLKRHVEAAMTKINVRRLCDPKCAAELGPTFAHAGAGPWTLPARLEEEDVKALVPREAAAEDDTVHSMFL